MVTITVDGDVLDITLRGVHRIAALKSNLRIPLRDVRGIRHDPARADRFFPGIKMPGTHLPFVYTAGTFYPADRRPDFWSVRKAKNAVVIQCDPAAAFDEIIVEVEDPAETVRCVTAALHQAAP